jgi:hypothetical protein
VRRREVVACHPCRSCSGSFLRFDQLAPMITHDPLPDPLNANLWTPSPFITALVILTPDLDQ